LEETIVIVDELGIKHSTEPKTGEPIVMTTDFLLIVDKGQGITSIAINLFSLAQERALFDESNEDETITSRVLKKIAKEDMIERLSIEVASLGIFDILSATKIR